MSTLPMSPLEVTDFSGGITDHYLNGEMRKSQRCDNLLLTPDGKLTTRPGSDLFDSGNPQIPAGAQRIGATFVQEDVLFVQSAKKVYYLDSGFQTLQGPSSNDVFTSGNTSNSISWSSWNKHLVFTSDGFVPAMKAYIDDTGAWQLRNAGLPKITVSPTAVPNVPGGTSSYLYRILFFYEYKVGDLTFDDFGPTYEFQVERNTTISAINPSALSVLPTIAAGFQNFDTSNIKLYIYRTIDGGVTFYKVGQVNNGTTTFNDVTDDTTAAGGEEIYTTGGVLDNDPPPLAKYVHVVGNVALYAHVQEIVGGSPQTRSNRFLQSVPDDIDSCPEGNFTDVEEEIKGVSSVNGTPMLLCNNFIYRIDGFYDELGRGSPTPQRISEVAGCLSHRGIVQTHEGIFWPGNDGFYYSDGYRVVKISDQLPDTYKNLVESGVLKNISGKFDGLNRRVYWTVQTDSSSGDNDTLFVLDVRFGINPESTFTTVSGGAINPDNFAPTDICFFNKKMIRADRRGYVFQHADTLYSDPQVDLATSPSSWARETLIYDYKSCATNFGTDFVRKWVTNIQMAIRDRTNASVQIVSINDDGKSVKNLAPVIFRGFVNWGDPDVPWGTPGLIWNRAGLIDIKRRFPAGGLRCEYKQVQLTNAYVVITNSDTLGLATVSGALKTATLVGAPSVAWPSQAKDYAIAFASDAYATKYVISARTDDTISFIDPNGSAPTGAVAWEIFGYPKNEALDVLSYAIYFAMISKTQDTYQSSDAGTNA